MAVMQALQGAWMEAADSGYVLQSLEAAQELPREEVKL